MTDLELKLATEKVPELFQTFRESFAEAEREIPDSVKFLQQGPERVQCTPIGLEDGIINFLYRLSDGDRSVVVKWARLVPRIAEVHELGFDESAYEEGLYRNVIECRGLETIVRYVPGSTPRLYWSDAQRHFFLMEDLARCTPLKQQLERALVVPEAFRGIARFMSDLHRATHYTLLGRDEFNRLAAEFDTRLHRVAARWMYEQSFSSAHPNAAVRRHTVALRPVLAQIIDDPRVREVNERLARATRHRLICFIHGDTHPGFAMVPPDRGGGIKVIDTEFAKIGYPARDVGYFLGEVVIWYYVNLGRGELEASAAIRQCARIVLEDYQRQMEGYIADTADFMHYVAANAGHFNAIRSVNLMPYPPFDDLEEAEARCVSAAVRLMKGMDEISNTDDFIATAFDS